MLFSFLAAIQDTISGSLRYTDGRLGVEEDMVSSVAEI